jgi:hypothetical protein
MKRIAYSILLVGFAWCGLLAAPASAQFGGCATRFCGPMTIPVGCEAYVGPGDVQAFTVWGSPLKAYSRATCGLSAAYMCDSTGGTDNACADVFTSTTTGKIIPKMIGSVMCFAESSGNCTAKIVYNIPLDSTCTSRGANGIPGPCDAVQNAIANRYAAYDTGCNGGLVPCMFQNAAGAGYTLNSSLTLAQPFTLWAVAYTVPASTADTLIGVGVANVHFSTGSTGNVLSTCDSATSTATNQFLNLAPTLASDFALTCVGGVNTLWQNGFVNNTSSGGATSVSGAPTIMASGGSPIDWWEFGIIAGSALSGANGPFAGVGTLHGNSCNYYGYTCVYSGPGDVLPFKAYWGFQAYSVASMPQRLIQACSAGDVNCQDLYSLGPTTPNLSRGSTSYTANGNIVIPTLGGEFGQACYVSIAPTGSTYNSTTGAVSLAMAAQQIPNPVGLVSGNNFAITQLTGTGGFASLDGGWTATSGTNTSTGTGTDVVNFTGPTGLGSVSITGGFVSTCTVKTFYDICTLNGAPCNFCTGGTPCDLTQSTITERAVLGVVCTIYPECAIFTNGSSQGYTGPGTTATAAPFGVAWTGRRTGLFSTQQAVISCGCDYGYYTAGLAFADDSVNFVTAPASDSTVHSIVASNNGTALTIYVDGASAGSGTGGASGMTQPYALGNYIGTQFFQGQFFGGGLTNTAITADQASLLNQQQHTFISGW